MKIIVRKDARQAYIGRTVHTHYSVVNWEWADTLGQVAGMELEVDTEYLFKDQFNTVPIPGISANGLRLMNGDVERVIDDIRPEKMRCNWCGKTSDAGDVCPQCGKSEYIERFSIVKWWTN